MSTSGVGAEFPSNFDGRRKQPKPIDAVQNDGKTLREKKLLKFRDSLVRRRKQANLAQTIREVTSQK
jgi:hypothetical protein